MNNQSYLLGRDFSPIFSRNDNKKNGGTSIINSAQSEENKNNDLVTKRGVNMLANDGKEKGLPISQQNKENLELSQ